MMATHTNGSALAAKLAVIHAYDRRGWCMTPTRGKRPYRAGWQTERLGCEDMAEILADDSAINVGVPLGQTSRWLIDVDLDHALAVEMADDYLPATESEFGRASKLRSHRLYYVTEPVETQQHRLPDKAMIVELRSTGAQTVFPGSTHDSGERIEWHIDQEPRQITSDELSQAVKRLAEAVRDKLGIVSPSLRINGHTAPPNNHAPRERDKAIGRASKYLAKIPPAISGQGGHDATFHAACVLVQGFELSVDEAFPLLEEWNQTCQPPWSERELCHKLEDASKAPGPHGELLNATNDNRPPSPEKVVGGGDTTPENSEKIEVVSPSPLSPLEIFRPFPVETLPNLVGQVVHRVSKAMGCDTSFVAVPALAVLGGAIGNSRRIQLKHGWTEPAIVWTGIVGESGTLKSPPLEWLTQTLRDREETALERHAAALEDFEAEKMRHDAAVAEWKKKKSSEPPPRSLVMPTAERRLTSDATIESVCLMLADNPRGMILVRDELAGWVSAFDQYKSHGGSDAAHWLSIHSAKGFAVDRKTGDRRTLFVPRPAMSITGGIQPATLRSVLAVGHIESGLAARLLFTFPPRQTKRWSEAEISPDTEATYKALIDGLFALEPQIEEGKSKPLILGLSPAAKSEWITFYNEHAAEQADLSGDLAAAWSKLECYAARLALVVHCVRVVTHDPSLTSQDVIDESSIGAGVVLSRWFGHEAKRVYSMLAETEGERDQRQLVEWITTRGGTASARDLQRGPRRFRNATAEYAESELNKLVKLGRGVWEPIETTPAGGAPSRQFRLREGGDWRHNPPNAAENRGCVAGHSKESVA